MPSFFSSSEATTLKRVELHCTSINVSVFFFMIFLLTGNQRFEILGTVKYFLNVVDCTLYIATVPQNHVKISFLGCSTFA